MRRMRLLSCLAGTVVALALFCVFSVMAQDGGSCVKCHTDPESLKKHFKVPKLDMSEGEG